MPHVAIVLAMDAASHRPAQVTAGLPDEAFVTDGLLTKRVLRAHALAVLEPVGDELLWDLGAGTSSIGIEWCLLHPGNRAIAVERNPERVARIELNRERFGVADRLRVVTGALEVVVPDLPRPAAVFVGGGLSSAVLGSAWSALPVSGRLVAHSVTAESDIVLLDAYRRWGGELSRVSVETAEPIGNYTGFRPARTVTIWAITKD